MYACCLEHYTWKSFFFVIFCVCVGVCVGVRCVCAGCGGVGVVKILQSLIGVIRYN